MMTEATRDSYQLKNSTASAADLHSSGGLSRSFVLRRQEEEGFNELPSAKPRRLHHIIIGVFKEPMVYLLLGCGVVYFTIGDQQEASMLLGFLFLIIAIEVFQERKAERALEALKELSSPRALVLREGAKQRIPGREVVRDDIIFINEGDRVPADAIVFSTDLISIDESLLTGESVPVEKTSESMIYAGTTLVRGQALAIVTAIGLKTEIGKIGKSIQRENRERTRLETHTQKLVGRIAWIAGGICVIVFLVFALTRHDWLQGFLVGLTLAMAILPNELPAVLTIFLALGAWRISQRRVLTRRLPAVENLGSTTVLCVDKTGTLTLNQMKIQRIFSNNQSLDLNELDKPYLPEDFHEVLEYGILASRQDPYDPMEIAFITAGLQYLRQTEHLHHDWKFEKEYPLSPKLLAITHAWKPRPEGGYVVGAKGAPEAIIDLCHMDREHALATAQSAEKMAAEGFRVLGVAKGTFPNASLPQVQHDFDFTFLGFIGIADPIRPEVPQAVAECHSAGIRVVMITGDHPITASSIAKKIGLASPDEVVTGQNLDGYSPEELRNVVKSVNVFSRVSPAQKLKLVEAFKANGEIVSMTGDGVNDAPALRNAHIGIAMGGRGTDVARESAALVLLDDDFGSIVEAVKMGRRVYANLKSALVYLFAVHLPITGMSIIPVVFKLPLVLLPAHIALLHLIIEPASSIAFEVEPGSSDLMNAPPRDPKEPLFDRKLWVPSLTKGASVLFSLTIIYLIALLRGQGEEDARALVFTTLLISNIALIFTSRRSHKTLRERFFTGDNTVVRWIALGSIVLLACVLYVEQLRQLFRFSILHPLDIVLCCLVGFISVTWMELFRSHR
ncbi:MAG: cation-translocating P-type ATPase [Bacillota bacterium]